MGGIWAVFFLKMVFGCVVETLRNDGRVEAWVEGGVVGWRRGWRLTEMLYNVVDP